MNTPILPCPFCKPEDSSPRVSPRSGSVINWVDCTGCGTFGPMHITVEAAIAAWNQRAAPAVDAEPHYVREAELVAVLQYIFDTRSYYRNEKGYVACDLDLVKTIENLLDHTRVVPPTAASGEPVRTLPAAPNDASEFGLEQTGRGEPAGNQDVHP